jgi:putative membrane protein
MMRIGTVSMLAASVAIGVAAPAAAAESDAEFVKLAADAGMLEVELGKHASAHGASADVRAFGKKMVEDHTKAANELKTVAAKEGLAVPAEMSGDHRKEVADLSAKRGTEFDEDYIDDMVEGHEHVVEAFRAQAKEGKTAIDLWAAKTLPTLEGHLAQAKAIDQKLEDEDDRAEVRDTPPVGTEGPRQEPGPMRERLPGTVLP